MALTRRELIQAGTVAGLTTVFASKWALGAAGDGPVAAAWAPPVAGTYALDQGAELDPGAFVVEAAVPVAGGLRQVTRHVFDNGCVEEHAYTWDATGVRLERLRVSFFGAGDTLTFAPPARVAAFGADARSEWTETGEAGGAPYAMTVRQAVFGDGGLDLSRRLELRRPDGLTVVEQRLELARGSRLPVRGSTVVLSAGEALDAEPVEWTVAQ